jgi:chromosome segregation ATPase
MKSPLFTLFFTLFVSLFISCGSNDSNKAEIDSLRLVLEQKATELDDVNLFLDAVNASMDSVITMEGDILRTSKESPLSNKEQIKQNIESFKLILQRQHERIAQLEENLDDKKSGNTDKMLKTISSLKKQLAEKDKAIVEMAEELEKRNYDISNLKKQVRSLTNDVAELTDANKAQEEVLIAQSDMLNVGYVMIATKDALKSAGVLTGGSLLKKSKLDLRNIDASKFTKIDIRETKTFTIPSKKAEVMTQMPKKAYKITANSDGTSTLTVTDATSFWSISKYLVIKY